MITELPQEQTQQIQEYRERYFRQTTSTEPADRARAEKAALKLARIGGVKGEIVWVGSPAEGDRAFRAGYASLRVSLRDSLRASIYDSLRGSICDSLRASLWGSLRDSIWGSLRDSIYDSLWDPCWLSLYTFSVGVLGIDCSDRHLKLLQFHNDIAASCFALWIVPGKIILCERPKTVRMVDGKLVGMEWNTGTEPGKDGMER